MIGQGPQLCSAQIPASAEGEGYSSGGYLKSRVLPTPLQSLPEIDLVSLRLTNLDPAEERSRGRRSLAAQRRAEGLIGRRLCGSNQVTVSVVECCRQVELGRESWPPLGRNRRIRERTSKFPSHPLVPRAGLS